MIAKIKTRRHLRGWQRVFWNRLCAGSSLVQRVQHDRRPATGVVVMPVSMMVATYAEHCPGLIPDKRHPCQILTVNSSDLLLSQSYEWINLCRASRRKITSEQRYKNQRQNHGNQRH